MELELRFFATVRETVGTSTMSHEFETETTVRDVLETLEEAYPGLEGRLLDESGEIAGSITVLRNGVHVANLDGPTTSVEDGDQLSITPPVTGG